MKRQTTTRNKSSHSTKRKASNARKNKKEQANDTIKYISAKQCFNPQPKGDSVEEPQIIKIRKSHLQIQLEDKTQQREVRQKIKSKSSSLFKKSFRSTKESHIQQLLIIRQQKLDLEKKITELTMKQKQAQNKIKRKPRLSQTHNKLSAKLNPTPKQDKQLIRQESESEKLHKIMLEWSKQDWKSNEQAKSYEKESKSKLTEGDIESHQKEELFMQEYGYSPNLSILVDEDFGLTEQQFAKLDRTVFKGTIMEERCSICLNYFLKTERIIALRCGHSYHQPCIKVWLKNRIKCPLCKRDQIQY